MVVPPRGLFSSHLLAVGAPTSLLAGALAQAPTYDGLEIDMFGLGNADSILVTSWQGTAAPVRVLLDGGNKSDGEIVLSKLAAMKVARLDHVVCTHLHDDHSGGLVDIIKRPAGLLRRLRRCLCGCSGRRNAPRRPPRRLPHLLG